MDELIRGLCLRCNNCVGQGNVCVWVVYCMWEVGGSVRVEWCYVRSVCVVSLDYLCRGNTYV